MGRHRSVNREVVLVLNVDEGNLQLVPGVLESVLGQRLVSLLLMVIKSVGRVVL